MKNDDYTYIHSGASGNEHSAAPLKKSPLDTETSPVSIPEMRPIGGISSVLIFIQALSGILSLWDVFAYANFYLCVENGVEAEEEFWDLYSLLAGENLPVPFAFVYLIAIVLMIIWNYRTAKNAVAMTKGKLDLRPGFYAASSYIPIVNIFYPYKGLKRIYNLAVKPENRDWSRTSGIIIIWWIFSMACGIFVFYEIRSPELLELLEYYPHKFQFALAEGFWSCLFDVISTLVSIRIIWIVNKGQSRIIESGNKQ
ncbi:DUF4328 domain-containing protein [Candidatus Spyradosoma sp. SGI.093]|uniref:DUF4328 domain-containing protein n=1 Tax=Candidatus Spyradosoma sp. SGI.093 TaxID=3420583 RepID=UPI003CFE2B00